MRLLAASLLAVFTLLAGGVAARAENSARGPVGELRERIEGEGETREAATRQALAKARDEVWEYISAKHPDLTIKPTGEYLQRLGIVVRIQGPDRVGGKNGDGPFRVVYRVQPLTSHHLADLRELSRVPYMGPRHRQAALVLGGLVLALLVFAGYLRFDEATHGYYAGRLFTAAAALVALVAFGVWWLI
jgi:hypothetical protein